MQIASSARRAFWGLAVLGGLSLAAVLALLLWQGSALASGVWLACQNAAAALAGVPPFMQRFTGNTMIATEGPTP